MGKSTPRPPEAPDPFAVAAADAQYNRINQFTPYGSLVFSQPGQEPAAGGQTGFVQGGLSPTAQALLPASQNPITTSGNSTPAKGTPGRVATPPEQSAGLPVQPNPYFTDGTADIFGGTDPAAGNVPNFGSFSDGGPSSSATLSLNPALQLTENLRLTSDFNMLADALGRQANLDSNAINLDQFDPIQSELNLDGISFGGPNFSGLPSLGNSPSLQTGVQGNQLATGLDPTNLQVPGDIGQFRGDVEQAVFDRGQRLLDPIFSDQERALRQSFATNGLPTSGEAVDRDLTRFEDSRNRAFVELADQAVITGGQEASRALGDLLGAQGQEFGQNLASGDFFNQALNTQFGQDLSAASFGNQALAQQFALGQDARNQLFNEQIAGSSAQNAASAQNLALQQQLLQNANAARTQGLSEQSSIRQNQFNELASLLGLQQVQAPGFENFIQPGQVDVMGAFAMNQQAQQNAFNTQNQRYNAGLGGLFGLGSAALMGPLSGLFGGG